MGEKLGYSALGEFITITALSKGLLMDQSVMALGGGGFLLPLLSGTIGVLLVLLLVNRRKTAGFSGEDPSFTKKVGMLFVTAAILLEVMGTVCRMGVNMKYETFLSTDETTVAAIALAAMIITGFFGITGMEGAGKVGLLLTGIVMALIIWANYSNYDIYRILPPVGTDARGYIQASIRWMMAFWPVILLWVFPQNHTEERRIRKSGIRAVSVGAVCISGILFACILVRSPYSVQTGFSPVEFLFEQATMGRTFYRLDPLLSVVLTTTAVVAGGLGLYTCGTLTMRMLGTADVWPVIVLMGMGVLCAAEWLLTPSSPLWGMAGVLEEISPYLFLGGIALGLMPGKKGTSHG